MVGSVHPDILFFATKVFAWTVLIEEMVTHFVGLKEQLLESRQKILTIKNQVKRVESQLTFSEQVLDVIKKRQVRKKLALVLIVLFMGISDLLLLVLKILS